MRHFLGLQHHRHTGKLLHHRHTSYRALVIVFLAAGLCITGLNVLNRAAAATFGVSAVVEAPIPSSAPIISTPTGDANTSSSSVLVAGSCPLITPQVVINITVDGNQAGTSTCDSRNDFSIPLTLTPGSHQIVAGTITISGQKGPSSTPLAITTTAAIAPVVTITSDNPFIYAAGSDITWTGSVTAYGQNTAYVHIDWGDNTQSNYSVQPGPQSFSHHYATLASHNILLSASNAAGNVGSIQIAEAGFTTATFPQPTAPVSFYSNTPTVAGLYGLYLTAVSATSIIWLEAKHAARQHAQEQVTV
jgi:hypothetical protein